MAQAALLTNGTKSTVTSDSHRASPTMSTNSTAGTKRKRATEQKFYAVREGRAPGVYYTWDECLEQVRGHRRALFKAFPTLSEAQAFVSGSDLSRYSTSNQSSETNYYAVQVGRVPGVYTDWPSAQAQIRGVRGPKHKKFNNRMDAEAFVKQGQKLYGEKPKYDGLLPERAEMIARSAPGLVLGSTHVAKDKDGYEFEPGTGPLPPGAEDGFDPNIKLDPFGQVVPKTEAEKSRTKLLTKQKEPADMLRIFTDGSSLANGTASARAGVGVYFGPMDPKNVSEPLSGPRQTNQRAELTAILRALDIAPRHRDVTIYTDSRYSINCVTQWYRSWARNGWVNAKGKSVENRDLVQEVRGKIEERDLLGVRTAFVWVRGHAGMEGNVEADRLAVQGAEMAMWESMVGERHDVILGQGLEETEEGEREFGEVAEVEEAFKEMEKARSESRAQNGADI